MMSAISAWGSSLGRRFSLMDPSTLPKWFSKVSFLFVFENLTLNKFFSVLPQTYKLLGRDFYAEIIEAHLGDRRKQLCDRADIAPITRGIFFSFENSKKIKITKKLKISKN